MEKRRLGKTSLDVSVIGFGGIPIQRVDSELSHGLLQEAYNRGINFIDTARGYNESENLIGEALEKIGRDKFILATKSMKRDYDGMVEELNISLKNLKTDYIDLFQFHNIRTFEELDFIMSDNGAFKALKEAKEKGIIREIGITSHSPELLDKAVDMGEFATIQCPYNPVERQAEELFKKAKDMNIGVIVMKPLAGGAITKGELSLRFIVDNPNISVVIPGMDTLEQVKSNSEVGINIRKLTGEEESILSEEANSLGTEFCRRCGYCLPCPQNIDIPTQFLMEGYYTRYNLKEWAQSRYDAMEYRAIHCIECGLCESKCPYNLPIRKMMKNVVEKLG
ncbi:aldo/keto reductase [Tissierella sp. MB52-C2]|uniref:aldo/keto reductase n=1 Tax=Tissierella sp. MB52-C2 TaxID=3070999 RepID=UPI00280A5E21|nr:aldo/keto reductase [Tissierella sp. MB52-C2]WMM25997.1 aldo/keto reductase [Tissierella sp. MB52-C2]